MVGARRWVVLVGRDEIVVISDIPPVSPACRSFRPLVVNATQAEKDAARGRENARDQPGKHGGTKRPHRGLDPRGRYPPGTGRGGRH